MERKSNEKWERKIERKGKQNKFSNKVYNCNKIETIRIKLLQMATTSLPVPVHNNNKWIAKPLTNTTNTEHIWQPKYKMALGCIQKGLSGIDKSFKNFHTFVVSFSPLAAASLLSISLANLLLCPSSRFHSAAGHLRRFVPSFVAAADSFITVNLCFGAEVTFVMPQKGGRNDGK